MLSVLVRKQVKFNCIVKVFFSFPFYFCLHLFFFVVFTTTFFLISVMLHTDPCLRRNCTMLQQGSFWGTKEQETYFTFGFFKNLQLIHPEFNPEITELVCVWVYGDIVISEYGNTIRENFFAPQGAYSMVFMQPRSTITTPHDFHTDTADRITDSTVFNSWWQGLQVEGILLLSLETHPDAVKRLNMPY